MDVLWKNLVYSVRMLLKRPSLTAVAIIAIALGIGATTAKVFAAEGARVGDSEDAVRKLYGSRVSVTPHKYTNGHYLTVTPMAPSDSQYRIIFETDGKRVTRYRAGRLPQVAYVEGCS